MSVREWSVALKLRLLHDYLGHNSGFLKATTKAHRRYYVDLFAGPGQVSADHGATVTDGSPLVALRAGPPAFTQLFWVEQKEAFADSLRAHRGEHSDRDIVVYQGDANNTVDEVLGTLPRTYPVLAFLDPRGPELAWETVRKLAAHKAPGFPRIELLILFPYNMAVARLMPLDTSRMVSDQRLDRLN